MSTTSSRSTSTDSRPALTRASTNCNPASVLPTPLDYPTLQGDGGSDKAKATTLTVDDVRVRMASQDRLSLASGRVSLTTSEQDAHEGIRHAPDSYFPPTHRSPASTHRPATPVRNNSTKDLINRYEAMSPSPLGTPSKTPVPSPLGVRGDSSLPDTSLNRPLSALKQRSRSPLRDSFRNLMSLFGKKGKSKGDGSSFISSRYEDSVMSSSPIGLPISPQIQQNTPRVTDDQPPLRSGEVLYLARSGGISTFPVWTNCKASLLEDRILLEWLTAYGNPSSSSIMLKKSTDVHSLAKSQVDPVEKSLLPMTGKDSYIFELTCPGSAPEKFATTSVAERSAWVSCVWDALLKLERTDDYDASDAIEPPVISTLDDATGDPFMVETSRLPRLSAVVSSSSMSREPSGNSYAASSISIAQSAIDSIRMRTGRYRPSLDASGLHADPVSEAPETPTKNPRFGTGGNILPAIGSTTSVQNPGNLSTVQSRLLEISAGNTNLDVSRTSTHVSRRSSVASNYSNSPPRATSHLITPQSLPKDVRRQRSQVNKVPLSRRSSTNSKYDDDETSIYDFYAQGSRPSHGNLASAIDRPLPEVHNTLPVKTLPSFNVLNLRPPQGSTSRNSGLLASCIELQDAEKHERALPDLPNPVINEPSEATTTVYAAIPKQNKPPSQTDDVHPLLALIQDHAEQQHGQTADIGHQIASLQQDISAMSTELRAVIAEQEPGTSLRGALEELCVKMERTATTNGAGLQELHQKIDWIAGQLSARGTVANTSAMKVNPPLPNVSNLGAEDHVAALDKISSSIDETKEIIKNDLPFIKEKLLSLQQQTPTPPDVSNIDAKLSELLEVYRSLQPSRLDDVVLPPPVNELRNVSPEKPADDLEPSKTTAEDDQLIPTVDAVAEETKQPSMPDIESKEAPYPTSKAADNDELSTQLSEVLSLLKSVEEGRKLGNDQQIENARYLQELNKWLESFVSNGTTQIQTVAKNVEKICQELAPLQDVGADKAEGEGQEPQQNVGIRSEVAALASAMKAVEERDTSLKALVTETLETVKGKEAESNTLDMNTVVQIIERQKQEQEATLKGIAAELSNEIRGERLRFVEAMKEATAINVQVHVDEFKKELSKEVMMMTCEVGRLQRERQMLEQQIADLFTFFAKQRAEMEQNQAEMKRHHLQVPQAAPPTPTRSNSKSRPLPVPKNKGA